MRAGWPSSWRFPGGRFPGGRFGVAVTLATIAVGSAALVAIGTTVSDESRWVSGSWRFDVATSAGLLVLAFVLRGRPGFAFTVLAFATWSISGHLESMSYATRSIDDMGTPVPDGTALARLADVLLGIAVFERTAIPAAILALYATAPERRLGPWVSVVCWGISAATIAAPFLRVARDAAGRSQAASPWWNDLSFQLDQPVPLLIVAALGVLGSLRAAARLHVPAMRDDRPAVGPDRRLLTAGALAMLLWVPAAIAYANRTPAPDAGFEPGEPLYWLPILLVLAGIVSVRWSRVVAWCSLAGAFESVATLVLLRAVDDYVALIQLRPEGVVIDPPPLFWFVVAIACGIVLFAFVAVALAFLAAWRPGQPTAADERTWALRGVGLGLAACAWYIAGGLAGAGLGNVLMVVFAPLYLMPIAVAIVAWRRLVPAVSEAEASATSPFRPMRYLEVIVAEALTRRGEHLRRAAFDERHRVATELDDLRATIGRLMADRSLTLAPAGGASWQPQLPSTVRRPSDRELDVIALVARGASNDEIGRQLVLSLKTVETHLRRLFARYDVTNRTELAVLAVREGWVDAP